MGDDQAQRWLNDFKRYLQQTEPEQSVKTNNYLIYLLDQSVSLKKLTVDVQKARRNKTARLPVKVIIPNMKISPESI